MGIGVIVELNLKPGGAKLWTAKLEERVPKTRMWKGCEQIYFGVDQNDPNHLVIVEKWTSSEDYARYREWAMEQPGSDEMQSYLIGDLKTTYLDDTGI